MLYLNIIDEQGRFVRLEVYNNKEDQQQDSLKYSYLYCRKLYEKMGEQLGLDKIIESDNL